MANYRVDVDGTTASNVVDVSYDKPASGEIGEAIVTVGNSQTNRDLFTPGAEVVVSVEDPKNPGSYTVDWRGEVNSKPSDTSTRNLTLEVTAEMTASQLEYGKVSRPFIERTNAEILTDAIQTKVDPESGRVQLHAGETKTGWSENLAEFELMDTVSDVVRVGDNALYFGISPGATGTLYAEYTGGPTVPGRRVDRLETGVLLADKGKNFDGFVYLVDDAGIQYRWELALTGRAENKAYELPVEDADITTDADYANGTLRYEFVTDGNVPDERALMIDYADVVTFQLNDRDTDVTADVEPTEYRTTRRLNGSILQIAARFAEEDGYTAYVDASNVLSYTPSGSADAPVSIDERDGSINVVGVAVDRDFDVRNVVTIQGKDDLRVSFESTQSIAFYNARSPKEEPIDDPSIRTADQARRRARGFLDDNAFDDGAVSFTVADPAFRDVVPGQSLPVTWPSEDLDGDYVVDSVERTTDGYTVINLSGNISL